MITAARSDWSGISEGESRYRRGNLREALLERATAVLRERGAESVSLRELARDAGVSPTAPARHFADRSELFAALAVARSATDALNPIRTLFPDDEDGTTATVFLATLHGIAHLINCGVVPAEGASRLVGDAVTRFVVVRGPERHG